LPPARSADLHAGVPDDRVDGGRRGPAAGNLPAGLSEARELQGGRQPRHLAVPAGVEPLPGLRAKPAGEEEQADRDARGRYLVRTGRPARHADRAHGSRARARAAARRLPRGVRAARRGRVRPQGGRRAPRHRGGHVEVPGVQGARKAAGAVARRELAAMHPDDIVINDFVDEELDAAARAEVEHHRQGGGRGRGLVADRREIRRIASSLELREPPVRSWTRLERGVKLEAGRAAETREGRRAILTRGAVYWPWLAAAAAI